MKKTWGILLLILLAIGMTIVITACGTDEKSDSDQSSAAKTSSEQSEAVLKPLKGEGSSYLKYVLGDEDQYSLVSYKAPNDAKKMDILILTYKNGKRVGRHSEQTLDLKANYNRAAEGTIAVWMDYDNDKNAVYRWTSGDEKVSRLVEMDKFESEYADSGEIVLNCTETSALKPGKLYPIFASVASKGETVNDLEDVLKTKTIRSGAVIHVLCIKFK